MQVTVNNIVFNIPFDLPSIPLGKYVEYYEKYGRELDVRLQELLEKDYKKELFNAYGEVTEEDISLYQQLDLDNHADNEALAWYSFWTGHDMFEARQQPFMQPLLMQYRLMRVLLKEGIEAAVSMPWQTEWNDAEWEIKPFTVNANSDMTFNEIITSKEVMRQIHKLSKGRWDAMTYLCAIFLRQKGEAFTDELIEPGGDRLELMKDLPMDIAVKVAFFLTGCVSIYKTTLAYLESQELETASLN